MRQPVARACIDQLFGADHPRFLPQDFEEHDSAILPDGTAQARRHHHPPAPYDGIPFIGEDGLRKQLEIKRIRLGEIEAALRRLEPIEREVERLIAARQQEIPDHQDVAQELVRIEELPANRRSTRS